MALASMFDVQILRIFILADLLELFQNHTFVGCVNQTRALVQHQVRLWQAEGSP